MSNSPQPVLDFHLGIGTDHVGRYVSEILEFDEAKLEQVHNYIQWLFPLHEASSAVPGSPVITDAEVAAFRKSPAAQASLRRAFERMLRFYGLTQTSSADGRVRVTQTADFKTRKHLWLAPRNHNLLRITRILKSLGLLGLEREAGDLFACLEEIYARESGIIGAMTFRFWSDAVAAPR